jgi:hypothetical protein
MSTCGQVYKELAYGLLAYSTNEFSFCSHYVLNSWMLKPIPVQRRAINTLWFDVEWTQYIQPTQVLHELTQPATIKLSFLTWHSVSAANWEKKKNRNLGLCTVGDLDKDMDVFYHFETWLNRTFQKSRKSGKLMVEYVV